MTKLYNVPRNTRIRVGGKELDFHSIDGRYSYCEDDIGHVYHLSASTEVEIVSAKNESEFNSRA